MGIKERVSELFTMVAAYKPPTTFREELNRQCKVLALPSFLIFIFSWLPYIELDANLYPKQPLLLYLRIGLSLVGILSMILFIFPYFRNRSYYLLLFGIVYLEFATALILGLVAADPAYMGGFSFLVMVLPIVPFQKRHTLSILAVTFVIFLLVGSLSGMKYGAMREVYGGFNLMAASVVSISAIFILDNIRRRNYEHHRSLLQVNEELQDTFEELHIINKELEQASIELSRKNEELRKANEIKSELLGIVAHDLKNPLQVIIGYTGLLQDEVIENPTTQKRLYMISKSSDKMMSLITDLLETASIDSGKLKMNITPVDMGQLAKTVVKEIGYLAEKKNQELFFHAGEDCVINGDGIHIRQIMDNLISNAIKFSPFSKRIWVTIEWKKNSPEERVVIFKVRDEGPGLTDEDKQKLFGKFQRLSARPTAGEASTGLGLSIIKDLVMLHKGVVHVESEPGKGSTFSVEFPVSAPLKRKTRNV
jgi:signal transduction histidine kinase